MKLSNLCLSLMIFVTLSSAHGSIIAVIDSGTDMKHEVIAPNAWVNPLEIADNDRDEDENGYQDDVHGWNFAEGNNQVIDYSYLGLLNEDVRKFFDVQAKMMAGTATEEEINWLKEMVANPEFIKKLQVYGNFMHGTHVSGISLKDTDDAKLLAVKLIPTEVKLPGSSDSKSLTSGLKDRLIKLALSALAKQQMVLLEEISVYVNGHKADIANGSFGTGYAQAKMIIEMAAKGLGLNLSDEEIKKYAIYFLNQIIANGQQMVAAAPKTLFVFAAGNDGTNNDELPSSPANVKANNTISVAATFGRERLAPFSNYGLEKVDVAAPGVSIESSVPGNKYLRVSGTSQAAPYVSNAAARIKDINTALTPKKIKKIIISTVDFKDDLKTKVLSGGIVNVTRASRAAELSLEMDLDEALEMARLEVQDEVEDKVFSNAPEQIDFGYILPLPSPLQI